MSLEQIVPLVMNTRQNNMEEQAADIHAQKNGYIEAVGIT